jgi:hypothetical protein
MLSVTPLISWRIFDGGTIKAQKHMELRFKAGDISLGDLQLLRPGLHHLHCPDEFEKDRWLDRRLGLEFHDTHE